MKDPKDPGTLDGINEASALKSKTGELQLPLDPDRFLNCIIIHASDKARSPVDLVNEIHEATGFWLQDRHMRQQMGEALTLQYNRGLDS